MKNVSVIFGLIMLLLSGCSDKRITSPAEMHMGPAIIEKPEVMTVLALNLNYYLDMADSHFLPDFGLSASGTWKFIRLPPDAKDGRGTEHLAVRMEMGADKLLLIYFPASLEEVKNDLGFVVDHAGRRIFSHTGQMALVNNYRDIDPEDFQDIIVPIAEMNYIEASRGTKEYEDLISLLEPFHNELAERWQAAKKVAEDYKRSYGLPTGSILTQKDQEALFGDKSLQEKLIDHLKDDWYGMITFPLWTPEKYATSIIIAKVFAIPTAFWKQDQNKPGYMDRDLTALQGAEMMRMYDLRYGFKSMFSPEEVEKIKAMINR